MKNKVVEFLKDESGQTSTEYILLVAVVAVIIIKFKGVLEEKLMGTVNAVFGKIGTLTDGIN
jgi:pilus assembly protein Flp/PilA